MPVPGLEQADAAAAEDSPPTRRAAPDRGGARKPGSRPPARAWQPASVVGLLRRARRRDPANAASHPSLRTGSMVSWAPVAPPRGSSATSGGGASSGAAPQARSRRSGAQETPRRAAAAPRRRGRRRGRPDATARRLPSRRPAGRDGTRTTMPNSAASSGRAWRSSSGKSSSAASRVSNHRFASAAQSGAAGAGGQVLAVEGDVVADEDGVAGEGAERLVGVGERTALSQIRRR